MMLLVSLFPRAAQAETTPGNTYDDYPDVTLVEQTMTPEGLHTVIRINVQKDAFLSSNLPNSNFGNDSNLRLGWDNGGFNALRILIQFDIGAIPRNAVITQAQLYIFQWSVVPANDNSVMGYRPQFMRAEWDERGVTWNNANFLGGDALTLSNVDAGIGWKTVDVTNLVRTWYSGGRPNNGLIVTGDETPAAGRQRAFNARESGNSAPYIQVEFTQVCDTLSPITSMTALPQFSQGTFRVAWNATDRAPSNCSPSGVANFDVDYRINGSSWHIWQDRTTSTSANFRNWANNGDLVEFRARATDHAGNVESFGNPQTSTRIDTQPPQVTVHPLPAITTSPNFVLSWSGTDNLSGIAHYDVQWRENGGSWQTLLNEATQTSFNVTGAQAGVTYEFRVRATDNVGNAGNWPDQPQTSTQILTEPTARILPFVPSILKPTAAITTSFPVNWSVVAAPVLVVSFEVHYQFQNNPWQLWQVFPGTQSSAAFPFPQFGLGDGAYGFEVIAIDSNGQRQQRTFVAQQIMLVDLADKVHPTAYMPVVSNVFNAMRAAEDVSLDDGSE